LQDYISSLKTADGTLLLSHRCKTSFTGFIISINSVIGLATELLTREVNTFKYFLTYTGFVQTLEIPGIKMLRFPGLESPGKRHRSWKTLEKSWNSKAVVLVILIYGTSIANLRRNSL